MKKTLLILLALPFLLNAQSVTVNAVKGNSLVKQVIGVKKALQNFKAEDGVLTRAGVNNELPDSIYEYYGRDGVWKILSSKTFCTYYDFGRVKQEIVYVIDYNGVERLSGKIDYVYVVDGNVVAIEKTYSYFNDIDNTWKLSSKELTKFLLEYYEIPLLYTYSSYNDESGEWEIIEYFEPEIEYDSENRIISGVLDYDDGTYTTRADVTYNEQGLYNTIISTESFEGEESKEKTEFKYNDKKQKIEENIYFYDSETDVWVLDETISYEYDEKGNMIKRAASSEDGSLYINYYENIYLGASSNDVITSVQSVVYPNPVSDVLFIRLEGADNAVVTLVNAAGGMVLQQTISGSTASIPVQSYAKGYYLLTIKTNKGVVTHKIVKL